MKALDIYYSCPFKSEIDMMGTSKLFRCTVGLGMIASLIFLNGCSSGPKSRTLPIAQSTMTSVGQDANVVKFSSLELRVAKDKLEQAEDAAQDKENYEAERLAKEALVNLELAEAKAEAKKTAKTVKDMEKSISTLRNELNLTQ
jgi:Domain of unknown function (DUF4398)